MSVPAAAALNTEAPLARGFAFLRCVVMGFAVAACMGAAASAPVLRVNVVDTWAPPFAFFERESGHPRLVGGIVPDTYAGLGALLAADVQVAVVSRVRVEASTGGLLPDFRCFWAKEWSPGGDGYDDVPTPLMVVEERLVAGASQPLVTAPAQLRGKRIGTVLGYRYPALDTLLSAGRVGRDDAPAETNLLEKQLAGRTDYSIVRLTTLHYLQGVDPRFRRLRASPWQVSRTALHCGVRRGSALALERLASAQQSFVDGGGFTEVLARYGLVERWDSPSR